MTYTSMTLNEYMSQVRSYKRLQLGPTEELFLRMIAFKERSAYDIYRQLDEARGGTRRFKTKAKAKQPAEHIHQDYDDAFYSSHENEKSMAYKNVHQRVNELHKMGLIKQTNEKLPRNAKKYRITTRGLFQCLLGPHVIAAPSKILFQYKDNIILKTILYQFFEEETVNELMSIFGDHFFDDYINKCCEKTLSVFENIQLEEHKLNPTIYKELPYYYPQKLEGHQMNAINENLYAGAYGLVYEILMRSTSSDHKGKFPNSAISSDKKFLKLIENLQHIFYKGCENLFQSD